MGVNLPDTLESATVSLKSAQDAAVVLDSSIKSLVAFQTAMGGVPIVSAFIQQPSQAYNPDTPLAESLGDVAADLEGLPEMFIALAQDMDKADDNLARVQTSLTTMSVSVKVKWAFMCEALFPPPLPSSSSVLGGKVQWERITPR